MKKFRIMDSVKGIMLYEIVVKAETKEEALLLANSNKFVLDWESNFKADTGESIREIEEIK